jgi:5-methylthioadenosine/S-adenosylhomocysteine deaminase
MRAINQERKMSSANGTIVNAVIVPMTDRAEIIESGYVTVQNGAISEVSRGRPEERRSGWFIDASGRLLLPGLVNAHTHLYQVLLRAVWEDLPLFPWLKKIYGAAEALRPNHFYAGTLLGCLEALRGGVTTICEHNFLNPHPDCAFETVRAIRDSGARAVFARTIMDKGEIVPACTKEKPDQAFKTIEDLVARERRVSREENRDLLSFMTGPNTPPINTSPELLSELRSFARRNGLGISAHVAESTSVVEALGRSGDKAGVVHYLQEFGIPGADTIFAHCVHLTETEIKILGETGTSVSHNPVSNMMLGDGIARVPEMLDAGVNVALGTDGAASNHSQDLFETMKAASLLQKVRHRNPGIIAPYSVLRMATIGGAKALGLDRLCGTIEAGKRADLILVDWDNPHTQPVNDVFSQIVHCAKCSDVSTVIVDGRVLIKNRETVFMDQSDIVAKAKEANRDLVQRL